MKKIIKKSSLRFFINQAAFLPCSQANGPGRRAVVWVQGCGFRCPGCFNPGMQEFKRRRLVSPEALAGRVLALENIEGVTFSGGEPFLQAEALAEAAEKIAAHGLNIVIFTGYAWEQLKDSTDPAWRRLLAAADLLVAGPYVKDRPPGQYLCSSDNQELVFLTERLKRHPDIINQNSRLMEFIIDREGNIITTGLVAGFSPPLSNNNVLFSTLNCREGMSMYKINHIGVVVSDMERSLKFYQDVLGCKVKDVHKSDELHLTYLDCAGQTIELIWRKTDTVAERDGAKGRVDHIAFLVPDIDKAVAGLKEKNVTLLFEAPREMEKQRIFFFSGPDGERLELVELKS